MTTVVSRISSPFVLILTFLILLGHLCELPAIATVAAHAHERQHDSSDHHADENEAACDAVPGVQAATHAHSNTGVDVAAHSHPVVPTVALPVVSATIRDSDTVGRRPPLFLLHAVLLI